MALLIIFFLFAIGFSFLCSILEAVLLSITPYYVGIQQQEGTEIGEDLARFKGDIDRPLAAILSLNTIANTLGAVGVGSQAAVVFGSTRIQLFGISFLSWEAMIAGGMTLCILTFSEIIPKTIGANYWERLTPFTVYTLKIMLYVLAPFVGFARFVTQRLKKDKSKPILTRNDFLKMTNLGLETGALDTSEGRIIQNLLRFDRIQVEDVMTPREIVVTADARTRLQDYVKAHEDLPFSRIPVYREYDNCIIGYVQKDELLRHMLDKDGDILLGDIRRELPAVSSRMSIADLLDLFLHKREHMALVHDSKDAVIGIVTVEDIVETVLGLESIDEENRHGEWRDLARLYWHNRLAEDDRSRQAGLSEKR